MVLHKGAAANLLAEKRKAQQELLNSSGTQRADIQAQIVLLGNQLGEQEEQVSIVEGLVLGVE